MDIYEKIKLKYQRRKRLAIVIIVAGGVALGLAILFNFVGQFTNWNQYHGWAVGLACVFFTVGAILLASNITALRDIEKTANRLNPDERELIIQQKSRAKTLRIHFWIIFPIIFVTSSILFMLKVINVVAWAIVISNFLAVLITFAIVRRLEDDKF